ncbi:hypothetical protein H6G41_33110 [Tolypothrix sp. FACHB-123]|uniref:CU044_2847 family protein n=1 Tax=Tolypothrix sp. FACHB-123 TaxID=2692868 RepID=UPI001689C2D2|nr:CU044_2847 family protein [Tolypothrix sp. FACHB-123]MBD2359366.1 hypothetical protein [Tolypothrix sp. FACHB-123]
MSAKITEIIGDDGEIIYIQYDEEDSDELMAVGVIDNIKERSEKLQKMMISTVRGYSRMVLNSVKHGVDGVLSPSKVTMEFGLQAGGEKGIPFVTKGTAQANVKVTIEWDLSTQNPPQQP